MEKNSFSQSKEEGKRTWNALQNQWAEAMGFFGAMFSSLISGMKKQAVGFLVTMIIFGAIGGGIAWMKKQVYHSEMTVSYAQLEKKIYGDMLFKLDQLIDSKQYSSLSQLLKIDEQKIREIKTIYGKNIHNEPLINDITVEKVPFYIVVDVYNPDILPELENALVNYISESEFIHERLKLNERNYKNEISHLKNQMYYMDSLKIILLSDRENLDADAVINLKKLNSDQNEIYGRIRDLDAALQFNKNIEIMDGFIAHEIPFNKILLKYILYGLVAGFLFRLFWLVIK